MNKIKYFFDNAPGGLLCVSKVAELCSPKNPHGYPLPEEHGIISNWLQGLGEQIQRPYYDKFMETFKRRKLGYWGENDEVPQYEQTPIFTVNQLEPCISLVDLILYNKQMPCPFLNDDCNDLFGINSKELAGDYAYQQYLGGKNKTDAAEDALNNFPNVSCHRNITRWINKRIEQNKKRDKDINNRFIRMKW